MSLFQEIRSNTVLFTSKKHLKKFQNFLDTFQLSMSFYDEQENNNKISFLDNEISCKEKFVTLVYNKLIFSGV